MDKVYTLQDPMADHEFVDWGVIPTMLEGESHTFGKSLHKKKMAAQKQGYGTALLELGIATSLKTSFVIF